MNEIEKRCEVGESDFSSLGFATVGDALKKRLDQIDREFLQLPVAMVPTERRDYRFIGAQSVFFEWDR